MAISDQRKYQTLCYEHGWGVKVDEDGCCIGCGASAFGAGVDTVATEITTLKAAPEARREGGRTLTHATILTTSIISNTDREAIWQFSRKHL